MSGGFGTAETIIVFLSLFLPPGYLSDNIEQKRNGCGIQIKKKCRQMKKAEWIEKRKFI